MEEQHVGSGRTRQVAIGLAVCAGLFLIVALNTFLHTSGWGFDFEAYFLAAERLARGDGIYQPWTLAAPFRPGNYGLYLYAPPLAVATLPFTMLSLPTATLLWFVVRAGLLALACAVMPVRPTIRLLAFAVAAVTSPVLVDLNLGNVSVLVLALLVIVWRWLDRPAGSIALAVAMSLRPTLGLLLVWWLLRRLWRPVLWTLLAGLVIVLITLPIAGLQGYLDFVTVLRNVSEVTGVANNLDLGSTVLRLRFAPILATAMLFAGYAVAIGAMLYSLRRDREVSFMVTVGASLLLAPLLWDHYLAGLLLPAAFLAQRGRPWALALPLLAWLPQPFLPFLAVAATLLPLLAPAATSDALAQAQAATSVAVSSKRTASPG